MSAPSDQARTGPHRRAEQWRIARRFARVAGAKPWHYAAPLGMTLIAATLEGASLALLVPLANGLATNDLTFVWDYPVIRNWHAAFPDALGAATSPNRSAFLLIILLLFAATVLGLVLTYAAMRLSTWRDGLYASRVKAHTLQRTLSFGMQYFDRASPAAVSYAVGYSETLLSFLRVVEQAADAIFRLTAMAIVLVSISWQLTLFLCLAVPFLGVLERHMVRRSQRAAEEALVADLDFKRQVENTLSCVPLLKAFALEDRTHEEYAREIDRWRAAILKRESVNLAVGPLQQTTTLAAVALAMGIGVALTTTDNTSSLSAICAFLLVARRAVPMIGIATSVRIGFATARPQLDRLVEIFDDQNKFFVEHGRREFAGLHQAIEFRKVYFSYTEGQPGLRGFQCTIPAGRTTALVGATGSGKTTVAALLMRLYDCPAGSIFVDGVDIREFSLRSLADRAAFVGQTSWLFNGTIRANLTFGLNRTPSDHELTRVLADVRLESLITRQPLGLEAPIGDRGMVLSGGERQRLCIARAILRNAELIVLDEATASLDSETERALQQVLDVAARGRTLLVIAHRLSTIRHADQILVMSDGAVVERGTWHELIQRGGPFASLWNAQTEERSLEAERALVNSGVT